MLSFVLALKPGLDLSGFLTLQITVLSQIFPSFPNLLSVQFTSNFQITLNQIHFYHSFNLVSVASNALHSTETAVLKVYNGIILALDSGFITALLLLDFSSAFDCVNHSILLEVLDLQFGIMAYALLWIANFLTNRSHLVPSWYQLLKVLQYSFWCPSRIHSWSPFVHPLHF